MEQEKTAESLIFREPGLEDGSAVYKMVKNCPPLDLNSKYSYLLWCTHFNDTSILALSGSRPAGFISGYREPGRNSILFVWQVAVSKDMRKTGLASRMLLELLSRNNLQSITHMETTVTPSNGPSRRLFQSFAEKLNTECVISPFFTAEHFGGDEHEEEELFTIGPFNREHILQLLQEYYHENY